MAGFDFDVPYKKPELALMRALLMKLQRFCRSKGLEMHYRHEVTPDHFYVTVNGPLHIMQASLPALARIMSAFAEGAVDPPDRRRRMRCAGRLIRAYWKGVLHISETINRFSNYVSNRGFPAATPNSFFFDTANYDEAIADRLWSLSVTLIAYENGEIQAPQMLEEIHTALEWVMQAAIGRAARNLTYAQMAEWLRDGDKISADMCGGIIGMKDLRRGAKHRGERVGHDDLNVHLQPCLEAIHQLLRAP
jgi:hypothetical protein